MNKKNLKTRCAFIAGLLGCVAMPAHAEDSNKEETPKGKAIITIFSDIHSGFGHVNDDRGFNLTEVLWTERTWDISMICRKNFS